MQDSSSTEELIRRAQAGDREAFETLTARYRSVFENAATQRLQGALGQRLTREDLIQESISRVLAAIPKIEWRGESAFRGWLDRIVRNFAAKEANKVRSQASLAALLEPEDSDAATPSRSLRRKERAERLIAALDSLSAEHREIVHQTFFEGRRVRDIAAERGVSPNSLSKLLARALAKLKETMRETESWRIPRELSLVNPDPDGAPEPHD